MDEFVVWCAGFFDGEGSVSIPRGNRAGVSGIAASQYWLQVTITQNRREPLEAIRARFGGRVTRMSQPKDKKMSRPIWRWIADADKGVAFLLAVRPHLRVKGGTVDIACRFQATMKQNAPAGVPFDPIAALAMRASLKAEMEAHNAR